MSDAFSTNEDKQVTAGFGDEWSRFDQTQLAPAEKEKIFREYFSTFPEHAFDNAVGADFGCGSGRWATVVAPRVKHLICVDASEAALQVARRNLSPYDNCSFIKASINVASIEEASLDFAYSLGVLHHIPDTASALESCVRRLKPGAPMLVYLYYSFDNRPAWYGAMWRASELARLVISHLPNSLRFAVSQAIAAIVYWPLARLCAAVRMSGLEVKSWPLGHYADKSFYVMRTDALDRFGTRLEQRFSRKEIDAMMQAAGLENIVFSEAAPFWCAVGWRSSQSLSRSSQ